MGHFPYLMFTTFLELAVIPSSGDWLPLL